MTIKKTRDITKNNLIIRLKNMSYRYLEKYSSSSLNLKRYLIKKVKEYNKEELSQDETLMIVFSEAIDEVIEYLKSIGYLDDVIYAKSSMRSLLNKGKSPRLIKVKLQEKGLQSPEIENLLSKNDKKDMELYSALKFLKRKSFGAYRKIKLDENTEEIFDEKKIEKEYSSMYRAGFSFSIIKEIMNMNKEEIENQLAHLQKNLDF